MRICNRCVDFLQIINAEGDVRLCSWLKDGGIVGNLKEQSIYDIYHGKKAERIRQMHIDQDYSNCDIDACPYLAMNTIEENRVDIDRIPDYPDTLYLAYEEVCNYRCTSCTHHQVMDANAGKDLKSNYDLIDRRIREILPYIKHIGANGRGEFFASKRILSLLANWKPTAPAQEVSVFIETNGSLFDEEHWKKIENLAQYHLSVAITVMSFDEKVYQNLSGCNYPISKIEKNLSFVHSLREQGLIDYFEIATVVQERNFRTMHDFVERCLGQYKPDMIRLRPYEPWGAQPIEVEWFADVRNKYHPYNQEYLEVMKDPIFKEPTVADWSGGLPSETGPYPYKCIAEKRKTVMQVLSAFIRDKSEICGRINELLDEYHQSSVSIYGLGMVGKAFVDTIGDQVNISNIYDKNLAPGMYKNYALKRADCIENEKKIVIITPINQFQQIKEELGTELHLDQVIFVDLLELIDLEK